jgi:hypothetical protein
MLKKIAKRVADKLNGKVPSGTERSSKWPALEKQWLKDHPTCAACGGTDKLEVHHKMPFHLEPAKELDPANLITLCESGSHGVNCHLLVGHRGSFKKYNPIVDQDAEAWKAKINAP